MSDAGSRERILEAAERRARLAGYNGFSFRDLAEDVGVKSSSVHYHFPTKADLGTALVQRYTERARERLGDAAAVTPGQAIERVTVLFRDALVVESRMCLCGVLGAERDALPSEVNAAVADFFRMLLDYLGLALGADWPGATPAAIVARLEGALILARSLGETSVFAQAIDDGLPEPAPTGPTGVDRHS